MSFEVLPYTFQDLRRIFIEQAQAHETIISAKQHLNCFENYLGHLKIKTLFIENEYVDKDFLEDYSAYYVRSFKEYKRNCIRLHFFTSEFQKIDFENLLKGENSQISEELLKTSYSGFMVLKPMPTTIIGKTCILTYEHDGRRFFPATRKYEANLYGINLTVNSLAYQEQDSIVAACASSSVWSALHGTALLFQHSLPSPVEITKWATKYFPFTNRHFPNKALSGEQMAIAIREVGLEPYLYNVKSLDTLKATVYAYLKGKIPLVLGFGLWEMASNQSAGRHAVTITGYSTGSKATASFEGISNLTLSSSKIDKIYVHDDQIGPFAKMEFTDKKIHDGYEELALLDTTWLDVNKKSGNIMASPEILIIPLYHKIRIPYEAIIDSVNHFNAFFSPLPAIIPHFQLFEWDIFLTNLKEFKTSILEEKSIIPDSKLDILTGRMPKYIWRAIGKINDKQKIEFIFDATDIDQGSFFLKKIVYDDTVDQQYKVLLEKQDTSQFTNSTSKDMVESFQ